MMPSETLPATKGFTLIGRLTLQLLSQLQSFGAALLVPNKLDCF